MSHKTEVTAGQICLFCVDQFFWAIHFEFSTCWPILNIKKPETKTRFFLTSWLKLQRTNPPFGSATTWNAARAGILETIQ